MSNKRMKKIIKKFKHHVVHIDNVFKGLYIRISEKCLKANWYTYI